MHAEIAEISGRNFLADIFEPIFAEVDQLFERFAVVDAEAELE